MLFVLNKRILDPPIPKFKFKYRSGEREGEKLDKKTPLKEKVVDGMTYVIYRNGRLVPKATFDKMMAKLAESSFKPGLKNVGAQFRRKEMTLSKVAKHIKSYLRQNEFLDREVPDKVRIALGIKKGTKVNWGEAVRFAMSHEVIENHSASCAKVLLDMDRFIYQKKKDEAAMIKKMEQEEAAKKEPKVVQLVDNFGDRI
jgi:hypothetical protein